MRKYFSFIIVSVLVSLPLIFTGCSDDEDDSGNVICTASDIVGTWRCLSSYECERINGKVVEEYIDEEVGSFMTITQTGNKQEGVLVSQSVTGEVNNVLWKLNKGILYELVGSDDEEEDDEPEWIPFLIKDFTGDRMTLLFERADGPFYICSKTVLERVK
ncbi:hypothetical protein [Xylanibacter muris]|uniref:Lipocalin-like domain-containing protein n=1 Tax=Xylanibacter muris TaxID=2736290 RepID=A0ABX2AQ36_9BACT|nr:hypothetical protein [Xylanibacter muris]NPD93088.1 hypothetical protein [Xylanibacter muris]